MKYSTFSIAALATAVAAIPHERHEHPVRRQDRHWGNRQWGNQVTTTAVVQQEAQEVVYEDQYGNVISTGVANGAVAQPTDVVVNAAEEGSNNDASSIVSSSVPPAPAPTLQPSANEPSDQPEEESTPSNSTSGSGGSGSGYGIDYSPYHSDHACKTADEQATDYEQLSGYATVRIYGVDCDQVPSAVTAAKKHGFQLFLGIWHPAQAASEAETIVKAVGTDWTIVHSISVGNEGLDGTGEDAYDMSTLSSGLTAARSALGAAGYDGSITTVEVWNKYIEDGYTSQLCPVVDYIAVNCHAFFDADKTAEEAGQSVLDHMNAIKRDARENCGDKADDIVITESGWPTGGRANGNAVPGTTEQAAALDSLKASFSSQKDRLYLFSAFNDEWKDAGEFGQEKSWGIYGDAPTAY